MHLPFLTDKQQNRVTLELACQTTILLSNKEPSMQYAIDLRYFALCSALAKKHAPFWLSTDRRGPRVVARRVPEINSNAHILVDVVKERELREFLRQLAVESSSRPSEPSALTRCRRMVRDYCPRFAEGSKESFPTSALLIQLTSRTWKESFVVSATRLRQARVAHKNLSKQICAFAGCVSGFHPRPCSQNAPILSFFI